MSNTWILAKRTEKGTQIIGLSSVTDRRSVERRAEALNAFESGEDVYCAIPISQDNSSIVH